VGQRHHTRQMAVQALYALEANPESGVPEALDSAVAAMPEGGHEPDREHLDRLVVGAWSRLREVDRAIEAASVNWKLSRMDRVDLAILRLGAFELLALPEVPAPVVLSEAVELAKEFGSPDSPAFVNGLLDKVAQELRSEEVRRRA